MNFIHPTYLFGLLGFIIPIAIHLWNKKEAKVIKVGSIQFVPTQDSNQSKSIQLNEIFLLLLRCLLLGIISFLMAGLISTEGSVRKNVVLVDPELLTDSRVQKALDTLDAESIDLRLMISDVPIYDPEKETDDKPVSLWELTNDLNKLNADSVLVFTKQSLIGIRGKRPEINKAVSIISIDPLETKKYLAAAYQLADKYILLYGNSDGLFTTYSQQTVVKLPEQVLVNGNEVKLKDQTNWTTIKKADTLKVVLVYDDEFLKEKTILEAQIRGIAEYTGFPINLIAQKSKVLTAEPDWLFWLVKDERTATKAKSVTIKEDDFKPLLYKGYSNDSYHLNTRLSYDNVLANDLSIKLLELFYEQPVDNNDQRVVSASQLNPAKNLNVESIQVQSKVANQCWIWVLLLIAFVFERFVSMKKAL